MISTCIWLALTYSCTNSGKTSSQGKNEAQVQNRRCYIAVDGKDTAHLNINTMSDGKVTGDLVINYATKPKNDGTLAGKFSGDTLFVDYTFTTGQSKDTINRNPLAFLREDSTLTLGVGVIETYMGRSYLVKNPPINFSRGRFKFNPSKCQ